MYHEGIYYDPECSSTKLDHGVLLVGYGTQDGEDYWLVKNRYGILLLQLFRFDFFFYSWGPAWGMEGYFMIARNRRNACGLATQASYPTGLN